MSDAKAISQEIEDMYEQKEKQDKTIIDAVVAKISELFPDPKQAAFLSDLFGQIFSLSTDLDEVNQGLIFTSSYIDAFYKLLVVERQLISEEEFKAYAQESYDKSIQDLERLQEEFQKESVQNS